MGASAMSSLPHPPPGFVLEGSHQSIPRNQSVPPPPPGFQLEGQPQHYEFDGSDVPGYDSRTGLVANRMQQGESFAHGVADLATFGLADELAAGVGTVGGMLPGGHGKGYGELLDDIRGETELNASAYPKTHLAGQVVGGVGGATGLARGGYSIAANAAKAGKGWLARLLGGAADGAIQAGGYGFGGGEGLKDRAMQAASNMPVGAALGLGGEALATVWGAGTRRVLQGAGDAAPGVNPRANVMQAEQFGIPISRAQATGSIPQTNIEDALRNRGSMNAFDQSQREAIDASVGRVQQTLAGPHPTIPNQSAAYEAVPDALRSQRDKLKAASGEGYGNSVDNPDVLVDGNAVRDIPNFIRKSLDEDQIIIDPMYHQGAARAMSFIDDYIGRMPKPGGDIQSVQAQLKWVENLRAGLRKNFPPMGQDAPALKAMSRAIDGWTDDVFERGLVSGSDEVLEQLKIGRAKWSEYMGMVDPRSKTGGKLNPQFEAQRAIKNVMEKELSPEEIGQYLFGASVAAPKNTSFMTAQLLRKTLGPDSPEWSAIKQSFWLRATRAGDETMNPAKIAKNLDGLLGNQGSSVAKTLFSESEREAMGSYAGVMRMLVPNKAGVNNSNTANRLMPQLQRYGTAIMGALAGGGSMASGFGPLEALGVSAATSGALKGIGAVSNASRVSAATRAPVPVNPSGQGGAFLRGAGVPMLDRREPQLALPAYMKQLLQR